MRTNPYKKNAHEGTKGAIQDDDHATKRWSHHIIGRRKKEWPESTNEDEESSVSLEDHSMNAWIG